MPYEWPRERDLNDRRRGGADRFKIAMIAACPLPAPRGTPIRIFRMAEELARRGHQVDVFTYHLGDRKEAVNFNLYRIANVATYKKQEPGPSYQKLMLLDPLLAMKVLCGTGKARYDVIHAHHFEGLLTALPSKWLRRLPLIFDVHTLLASELPSYAMGLPQRMISTTGMLFDRHLPRRADHVICVSEEIRARLHRETGLPHSHFSMIPNGVEAQFFAAQADRAIEDRAKAGHATEDRSPEQGANAPRLVFAGNLAAYQGVDLLLEAFALALAQRPDLRLQIITNSDFKDYEAQAQALAIRQSIDLEKASLDRLPGLLAQAAVAANPRTECAGLPQKLLNYMAVGCPIVSFEGSARHLENEVSAMIAPNGDVAAFSQAILRLVDDRDFAETLGQTARAFAQTNLSWPSAVTSIEAVYAKLKARV